ncbi:MAG: leucine--tRNA ligase [Deltaproteobacteria bacterium]|nr:leucine--tRNA ligase [Deltaproteobacteria bacterium]
MRDRYDPLEIEPRWQERWKQANAFRLKGGRPKLYVLEMLPYPSGRIHMGHVRNYSIGDALARFRRMQGFDVLHPMGWDAFGLPAENAAIKQKTHPARWTWSNIAHMRSQLRRMGYSYDWDREVATCHAGYYRWQQSIFIRMFEKGLVYRKGGSVNYCPKDATVLANEQVVGGRCWRCGTGVEERDLEQWFVRITDYAERLLEGLDTLEGCWPDAIVTMQRNWIGKSVGCEIRFPLEASLDGQAEIAVFTTRPDTLFGVTSLSLAAEHPMALPLARQGGHEDDVRAFAQRARKAGAQAREAGEVPIEGVSTGAFARHPLTGERLPVYVASFVLMQYGTGAVMAVPAHDSRDFVLARTLGLPVKVVIQPPEGPLDPATMMDAYEGPGTMAASAGFDGLPSEEGKLAVIEELERQGKGRKAVRFRIRDWLISRQRFWGAPIPMLYCERCGIVPEREDRLPIILPEDVEFTGVGGSPLAQHPTFTKAECPRCSGPARRETDTMDTFVDSSWYFLRYLSPRYEKGPVDPGAAAALMPIDQYIGGAEHATGHLIYSRFFHRMLRDMGIVPANLPEEPFTRLVCQGMVCMFCGREGCGRVHAMSKSHGNLVEPDAIYEKYGADTARVFILFAGPTDKDIDWTDTGVEGAHRFLQRVWRYVGDNLEALKAAGPVDPTIAAATPARRALRRITHQTIRRVETDIERFQANTAISAIMELVNAMYAFSPADDGDRAVQREAVDVVVQALSPFAPHLADELFSQLGGEGFLIDRPWPRFDADAAREDLLEIPVQVNGKLRGRITAEREEGEDAIKARALGEPNVAAHLAGRPVKKVVYVPGKIVSIVV